MRTLKEWIGVTDDAVPPPRVRLRIFERNNGICYLSGRKIGIGEKWQLDHIIAICNGGKNIESNLAPVLTEPHKLKTSEDLKEKSLIQRKRMKHLGISGKKRKMGYRRFNGQVVKPRWE